MLWSVSKPLGQKNGGITSYLIIYYLRLEVNVSLLNVRLWLRKFNCSQRLNECCAFITLCIVSLLLQPSVIVALCSLPSVSLSIGGFQTIVGARGRCSLPGPKSVLASRLTNQTANHIYKKFIQNSNFSIRSVFLFYMRSVNYPTRTCLKCIWWTLQTYFEPSLQLFSKTNLKLKNLSFPVLQTKTDIFILK